MEKIEITKEGDTYIAKDTVTNVVDEGGTVEEALENLREAMQMYHEDAADKAMPTYTLEQAIEMMTPDEIEKLTRYVNWILGLRSDV